MLILFNRDAYSTIKQTNLESSVIKDDLKDIQSKEQTDKVATNYKTEHLETEVKIQYDDNTGCIRLQNLDENEISCNISMFFIESTQQAASKLSARQSCSIELVAR